MPEPVNNPSSWRSAAFRAVIAVAVCYGVGALATQVVLARQFSHSTGYVARLGDLAYLPWILALVFGLWGIGLYLGHRRRGLQILDVAGVDRALPLIPLLVLLTLSPFLSAYASHAMLPALAAVVAPLLLASVAMLPRLGPSARAVLGHRAVPFVAAALAAAWYFTVSYYRHANFGSGSRDMGLFFQTVWLLSQFQSPLNTLIAEPSATGSVHAFADHMEFIDVLVVPLVWLWRDAGALLLVQALITGSGVAAVMRLAQRKTGDGVAALLFGGCYFLAYPIGQGIQFDWNPTTLSVGLIAWAFDLADRRRYPALLAVLVLIGMCKENLWLYVAAFGLFMLLDGHSWKLGSAVGASALVLFGVELKLLFPLFREGGFRHFYFKEIGGSFGEVALNVLASPLRALGLMVTPGNKVNGLLLPFSSTAWICLAAPAPLVVALPAVGERFLSSFRNAWWGHHYGGPTSAIATVAAVYATARVGALIKLALQRRLPSASPYTLLALVCLCATLLCDVAGRWAPLDLFVLEKPYLPAAAERVTMRQAVAAVPDGVAVAAQNYLVAHLAARAQIHELQDHGRAEVVVLNITTNPWPYNRAWVERLARQLARDPGTALTFCQGHSWVFQRGRDHARAPSCPALDRLLGTP